LTNQAALSIENVRLYEKIQNELNDRKIAEDHLKQSEEKYRTVFETHSAVKLFVDPDNGAIIDANQAAALFYGWSIEELKGMNLNQINVVGNNYVIEVLQKIKSGDQTHFELKHRLKNGDISDIELYSSIINIAGKDFLHFIIHDITEKKRVENELEKHRNHLEDLVESRTEELDALNRELISQILLKQEIEQQLKKSLEKEKELNQLKNRFISTASHEFKTPLTSVLSSVELLQRYSDKWIDAKKSTHLERIKSSVLHLTDLINEVLYVSRAEAGRLEFVPLPNDLHEICENVIEEAKLYGNEKHEFILNYPDNMKICNIDSKHIYTILQNLVSNAAKYSPNGGKIELKICFDENNIIILVCDNGIGIPESEIPNLFEPFHRSDNVGEIGGTGLGLTIVKNAVDLHKGRINILSELGKGTTFKVEIPLIG
jgi:PAS domain S-box-containing protein